MSQNKSVLFCTPMYNGQCYFGYVSSLLHAIMDLQNSGYPTYWMFLPNESLIQRGRNFCVDYFLNNSECTHLMFVDSDIVFPPGSVKRLLEYDKDIIAAPYPKKYIDWGNIYNAMKANHILSADDIKKFGASYVINLIGNDTGQHTTDAEGLLEVAHVGTGFMMIKREVFAKLEPHMNKARAANFGKFDKWYTEYFKTAVGTEGVFLSEDWFFCEEYRKIGGKVHLVPDINLDHIGTHIFTGDIITAGANIS